MQNSFVYDDESTIINNYFIRHWSNFPNLFTSKYFVLSAELTYRPVVTLSYFIDYTFWHLNPLGYHLTNMLLHAMNSTLFFIFAFRVLKKRSMALVAALFFSSFPVFSEAVNAIGFREDLMAFLFLVLAFIFYLKAGSTHFQGRRNAFSSIYKHADSKSICDTTPLSPPSQRGEVIKSQKVPFDVEQLQKTGQVRYILYYSLSLICYFLSLFSKEMAITLPILIVLSDLIFQGLLLRINNPLLSHFMKGGERWVRFSYLKSKIFHYYLGYFFVTVFYVLTRFYFLHNPQESHIPYPQGSLFVNFLTMTHVLAYYVKLLLLPFKLNADYVVPFPASPVNVSFWLSLLLFIATGMFTFRLRSRHKHIFFFILWFFVTLIPVTNIVPLGNIMAERYLYIPGAGFCMIVASLLLLSKRQIQLCTEPSLTFPLLQWEDEGVVKKDVFAGRIIASYPPLSGFFIFVLFFILMGNACLTLRRNNDWKDGLQLWSKTILTSPNSFRAHINLGNAYEKKGLNNAAFEEYQKALSIDPNDADVYNNLGIYYNKMNLFDDAIQHFTKCLNINPRHARAYNNLGVVLTRKRRLDDAIQAFKQAISMNPLYPDAHNNLGIAYYRKGLMEDAEREFKLTIDIEPYHAEAHNDLGILYTDKHLYDDAIYEFETATRIKPDYANAHMNLGAVILRHRKEKDRALFHLKESIKIDPRQEQEAGIKKLIQQLENTAR
ncbi:MAG: tetratricopeptide repeat protein [Candidatus Brocadia sp.]